MTAICKTTIASLLLVCCGTGLHATVKPNSLFSDHMVLQRNITVPVWGTADAGETVTVSFNGQTVRTQASNGKWMVQLQPMKAGGPYTMTITGTNTVTLQDVLVGEVWVCSGQSNMERQLGPRPPQKPIDNWEQERDAAQYPDIRQYYVPLKYAHTPPDDINSNWVVCSPSTVSHFSAVGYFFAKHLYSTLHVPIGLLFSAYGGTPAENWTSRAKLENNPELLPLVQAYDKAVKEYPARLEAYRAAEPELMRQYARAADSAKVNNKPLPKQPLPPTDPAKSNFIAGLYNAMIIPLQPYAIKGVIWYQGESNNGRARQYRTLFPAMIENWRKDWKQGDFPFLFVQIAPHKDMTPEIREAQLMAWQKTPHTAMVVTTDCGDARDIHPTNKQPVGERLALAANALAYGRKLEYSGPVYHSMKRKKHTIELRFTHTGKGLWAKDGPLKGFTIAGADKQFVPANATIKGKKVIVYADAVHEPVAVRYGWANVPDVNLFNKDSLPASPFRTDTE